MALDPALLCWVPLSLLHSSARPPVIPPLSHAAELLACERSVRLEDEPPPSLSLLWRLLEIQNTDRRGVTVSTKSLESPFSCQALVEIRPRDHTTSLLFHYFNITYRFTEYSMRCLRIKHLAYNGKKVVCFHPDISK